MSPGLWSSSARSAGPVSQAQSRDVLKLHKEYETAISRQDASTLERLFADDYTCTGPHLVAQDIAVEQSWWSDFNQRLDGLDRALARR